MNAPLARRNDPCPCGSGLKFKACHGKIEADAPRSAAPVRAEDAFASGMQAFRGGQPDAAIAWFDRVLALEAQNPFALHFKGYALCQKGLFDAGLPLLESAVEARPDNPDFQGNLGIIRYVLGDPAESKRALERAIALAPRLAEPHSNLALALRDLGDFEGALAAARRALELRPDLPAARLNLAMSLLALGRFKEAWPALRWRPDPSFNLRDPAVPNRLPHATSLPDLDRGARVTLHGEQGLGDMLFFLRFAPSLRQRGARLRFWGDARLHTMLLRAGIVDEVLGPSESPAGVSASHLVWVGDLPGMLGAGDECPPPVRLVADATRRNAMAARLAPLGPAPYAAVTWRAGLERRGKTVLAKAIAPELLGGALREVPGTLLSVQRDPQEGEGARFQAASGRVLHDFSALNADLEDMLALMGVVDEYVGVSNTNTHLRAAAGMKARVLVAFPPEWRWLAKGESSPWFPGFPLYRAAAGGRWDDALARLSADLRADSR
jgi:Flp pilus assembly protein TadD